MLDVFLAENLLEALSPAAINLSLPVIEDEVTRRTQVDTLQVLNNSERVSVRLHWSGGFESCHELARPVIRFCQLESYDDLIERTLALSLQGHSNPEIAVILAKENYVSPRSLDPVSRFMTQKLLEEPFHRRIVCGDAGEIR